MFINPNGAWAFRLFKNVESKVAVPNDDSLEYYKAVREAYRANALAMVEVKIIQIIFNILFFLVVGFTIWGLLHSRIYTFFVENQELIGYCIKGIKALQE